MPFISASANSQNSQIGQNSAEIEEKFHKYQHLVHNIAKSYSRFSNDYPALISRGNEGLLSAIQYFDPARCPHFEPYAIVHIRLRMIKALRQERVVKIPHRTAARIRKVKAAIEYLNCVLKRMPDYSEIAEYTGIAPKIVHSLMTCNYGEVSMSVPLPDGRASFEDLLPDTAAKDPSALIDELHIQEKMTESFTVLNKTEKTVISMRFGLDGREKRSLEEIGIAIGKSKERVRQIGERAMKRMRKHIGEI